MRPATLPTALEALDRVRHGEPFDVAVLDMSMPDCDGIDLATRDPPAGAARSCRSCCSPRWASVRWQELGADHLAACLSKPIKASQLFARWCRGAGAGGSPCRARSRHRRPPVRRRPLRVLVAEDNPSSTSAWPCACCGHLGYGRTWSATAATRWTRCFATPTTWC
jgi:hypothetical protein